MYAKKSKKKLIVINHFYIHTHTHKKIYQKIFSMGFKNKL